MFAEPCERGIAQPSHLFEATVATLTAQAANFGGSGEELAARRDDAELRLLRALDEVPSAA